MPWFENVEVAATDQTATNEGRSSRKRLIGALIAVVVVFGAGGFLVAHSLSSSAPASTSPSTTSPAGHPFAGAGGVNGIRGRGTVGTVRTKASNGQSFTMTTTAQTTVTVDVTSATVYRSATAPASFGSIFVGARVAVTGSVSGSKITAADVVVILNGFGGDGSRGIGGRIPALFGSVASVDVAGDSFKVTTSTGTTTAVQASSTTIYRDLSGKSSGKASFASVVVGAEVAVTGTTQPSGVVIATAVRIIPAGGFGGGGFGGADGNPGSFGNPGSAS